MSEAVLTWVILLTAFVSLLMGSTIARRRRTPLDLRPIWGYEVLPLAIDEAVESDRPVHFSLGASAVGGDSTVTTLAANDLIYYLTTRLSFGRRLPLVTLSDPLTLAVASDTLRKAYALRNNLEVFRSRAVAWFPQGERSLAFAAGAASLAADADISSHILLGNFGAEMAIINESNIRRNLHLIANSTTLEGQAVAYAMGEQTIIGEELFAGSAYLDRDNTLNMGGLIAQDTLRWMVIIFGILLGILLNAVD